MDLGGGLSVGVKAGRPLSVGESVTLAIRPEETLQTMVRRLADSLGVAHAAWPASRLSSS